GVDEEGGPLGARGEPVIQKNSYRNCSRRSPIAQWESPRLLTGGLLVRVQLGEPILATAVRARLGGDHPWSLGALALTNGRGSLNCLLRTSRNHRRQRVSGR